MNTRPGNDSFERLNDLSDALLGEAEEMDYEEAGELLRAAGVDPRILKASLHRRALKLKEQFHRDGQNPPKLLDEMIGDLGSETVSESGDSDTPERSWISKLLNDIRELPQLLHAGFEPSFSNSYRNKKELTATDKALLDRITEEMKQNLRESR